MHLDPSTPAGLLDTVGHLLTPLLSGAGTFATLTIGRLLDRRK